MVHPWVQPLQLTSGPQSGPQSQNFSALQICRELKKNDIKNSYQCDPFFGGKRKEGWSKERLVLLKRLLLWDTLYYNFHTSTISIFAFIIFIIVIFFVILIIVFFLVMSFKLCGCKKKVLKNNILWTHFFLSVPGNHAWTNMTYFIIS